MNSFIRQFFCFLGQSPSSFPSADQKDPDPTCSCPVGYIWEFPSGLDTSLLMPLSFHPFYRLVPHFESVIIQILEAIGGKILNWNHNCTHNRYYICCKNYFDNVHKTSNTLKYCIKEEDWITIYMLQEYLWNFELSCIFPLLSVLRKSVATEMNIPVATSFKWHDAFCKDEQPNFSSERMKKRKLRLIALMWVFKPIHSVLVEGGHNYSFI